MTKEEAINIVRNIYQTDAEKEALATLIPELAESEDERIIKTLQDYAKNRNWPLNGPTQDEVLAYLEKQKDARKAIEAVDRIDKYIDEHLANAHDMKDSSPDKKYYRGWDDALGEMARILQDVYSGEKQKEQKQECGEKGLNGPQEIGDWRGDEGVCKKQKEQNGEDEECTDFTIYHPLKNGKGEYECIPYSFYDSLTFFSEDKDLIDFHRTCFYTEEECNEWIEQHKEEEGYEAIPVESTLEYKLGFKAGKESEKQKEQEHICDSTQYEEGFKTGLEIGLRNQKEQKPVTNDGRQECPYKDLVLVKNFFGEYKRKCKLSNKACDAKECEQWNELQSEFKNINEAFEDGKKEVIEHPEKYGLQKPAEWSEEVELLFRGEKVTVKRPFYRDDKGHRYSTTEQDEEVAWNALRAWCEKKGISLYDLYPKAEWSEEDETRLTNILIMLKEYVIHHYSKDDVDKSVDWLENRFKSLRPQPKQEWSEEDEKIRQSIIKDIEFERNYTSATTGKVIEKYNEQIAWLKAHPLNLKKKNEDVAKLCSNEWSEEDERLYKCVLKTLELWAEGKLYQYIIPSNTDRYIDFFKSLKFRVQPQPKQEWSEEDEEMFNTLVSYVEDPSCWNLKCPREKLVAFIESLPKRFSPQPKQEWSEEETKDLVHILKVLDDCYAYGKHDLSKTDHDNLTSMIKSLRPQSKDEYGKFEKAMINGEPISTENNFVDIPLAKWSEEDEKTINMAIETLEHENYLVLAEKLKSLRPQPKQEWSKKRKKELGNYLFNMMKMVNTGAKELRYTNDELEKYVEKCIQDVVDLCPISQQPKTEWSEEDETRRNCCMIYLANARDCIEFNQHIGDNARERGKKEIQKDIDWLKYLPERFNPQQKAEWSEEDKKDIAHIIRILEDCYAFAKHDLSKTDYENLVNKLKSLHPQPKRDCKDCAMFLNGKCTKPHWKPSEEQVEALEDTMTYIPEFYKPKSNLASLLRDLKKQV